MRGVVLGLSGEGSERGCFLLGLGLARGSNLVSSSDSCSDSSSISMSETGSGSGCESLVRPVSALIGGKLEGSKANLVIGLS